MGSHRLAHDRSLEYVYIYIYIYVCTCISISRAETVELRTWISQRSQRQLRPPGVSPDKYLEPCVSHVVCHKSAPQNHVAKQFFNGSVAILAQGVKSLWIPVHWR
jgi:hypothetical protein